MYIISAREFRSNQSKYLDAVNQGRSVVLKSRLGSFKITPVDEDDTLITRLVNSLREVKDIRDGKLKGLSVEDLLNEL